MKLFLTKIPFSLLFIFSSFLSSANYQDSLSENELAHIQANIDSIDVTMVDQQMKLKKHRRGELFGVCHSFHNVI